ncbi:hypothetical protein DVH24_041479 [Malus domestica]|uniref:Uncharacterized protein n=1 Tax=Malus domestica TaxID=3750 RepID=A0A498IDY1_MALDO|nr:hypothetical protein DVH24_041479 [Malus domestica]
MTMMSNPEIRSTRTPAEQRDRKPNTLDISLISQIHQISEGRPLNFSPINFPAKIRKRNPPNGVLSFEIIARHSQCC